jgi:threonine dehydrogenase-like Zn-dependent dehydrogenase
MGAVPTEVHPEYKGRKTGEKMKALAWFGAKDVRIVDAPVPDITEPDDVILKVTGTTICGSDLHLYHGEIMTMQKGDILGHGELHSLSCSYRSVFSFLTSVLEFMGIVDKVGPNVTNHKPGDRVVVSFQIACGECSYCKQKLSNFCERTNPSTYVL